MRAYFGREASARQVVVAMELHNPGSDPLRAALMRLGAPGSGGGSSAAPAPSGGTTSGSAATGRVQTENLAPPPANRR
jgi:hypothetical protein